MLLIIFTVVVSGCSREKMDTSLIKRDVAVAVQHYTNQLNSLKNNDDFRLPRTTENGEVKLVKPGDWTCGFFPGSLWYLYKLTGDEKWKTVAADYTSPLESLKTLTSTHDLGFMMNCSFGTALNYIQNDAYKKIIVQSAKSLSARFRNAPGTIQSWNTTNGWQKLRGWECPVITDNMMNLELMFKAFEYSHDSTFYKIAVSHADATLKNHYRKDYSCYHVVDYSLSDGSVRSKQTAQGYADSSSWARGQSWGIYGFTVCYRETGDKKYLQQAINAANFIKNNPNYPDDLIPYWDFDAPKIPNEPRDVSAATILASALYEMETFVKDGSYKDWADKIIANLSTDKYMAVPGTNGNFLLKHSVGSIPHNMEIDVPLNYADYYFLEALSRKADLEK